MIHDDAADKQPGRSDMPLPAVVSSEFPLVKTIRRGWLTAGFVSWLVGTVASLILMVAACSYVVGVMEDFGVRFDGDRIEMAFSDGSRVNIEKLATMDQLPFNNKQLTEISDKLDAYGESGEWVLPLIILGGVGFLTWALCLPFYIQACVLIYKGWKSLQPLRVIDGVRGAQNPLEPILSVVLLLVPYVNAVWCYFCLPRYARYGRALASATGREYRGPGFGMGLFLCILFSGQMVFSFVLGFSWMHMMSIFEFVIWSTALSSLINLILSSVLFVFSRRLSLMVEDFGSLPQKGGR